MIGSVMCMSRPRLACSPRRAGLDAGEVRVRVVRDYCTQANLEVLREGASFRAAFQSGEAAVVQFKERTASRCISTSSGDC